MLSEVPEELIYFLGYFVESTDRYIATVNENSIKVLHEKVSTLKKSREGEADSIDAFVERM